MFRIPCVLALLFIAACSKPIAPTASSAGSTRSAPAPTPSPPAPERPAPTPIVISIVSTNDLHGRVQQLPLLGGYVKNLREARAHDQGGVLVLDAGDAFQGTLESNLGEGAAVIRAYNALGYAAASVGNHEFDFGPAGPHPVALTQGEDPLGALDARVRESRFPWLAANLVRTQGGAAVPGVVPSVLLVVAGIRIGIVGGLTKDALTQTQAANVVGLELTPLAESVAREARSLRAQGAAAVIALVHAGGECHDFGNQDDLSRCDPKAEVFELARALSVKDVDLIVGGHTHDGVAHRVHGIPIIEAYLYGRAFGRADLSFDRTSGRLVAARIEPPHPLCNDALDQPACTSEDYAGAPVQRDSAVLAAIASDLERASAERARPLGVELTGELKRNHKLESAIGNLFADLARAAYPSADAAVNNAGSLRIDLPRGRLSYGQLFELFPFDNAFAELRISAGTLAAMVRNNLETDRGFLAISGLRASARCEDGQLAVTLERANGKRVPPSTPLRVVMSDFLAAGGDDLLRGIELPADAVEIHRDQMMREAFERELEKRARIDPADRSLFDPAHPRVRYSGVRPLHCAEP